MRLDFSQYHPGGHWPGAPVCWTLPGGPRRHLYNAWVFHRRDQVLGPFHKQTLCRLGRHKVRVWYGSNGTIHPGCLFCDFSRLPSEQEIDKQKTIKWKFE